MTDYEELARKYGGVIAAPIEQKPAQQLTTTDAEVLAQKFGGTVVEPESMGVGQMLLQAGTNAPRSLYNLGKDVVTAVANPIDTATTLIDLGAGALQAALPESLVQARQSLLKQCQD